MASTAHPSVHCCKMRVLFVQVSYSTVILRWSGSSPIMPIKSGGKTNLWLVNGFTSTKPACSSFTCHDRWANSVDTSTASPFLSRRLSSFVSFRRSSKPDDDTSPVALNAKLPFEVTSETSRTEKLVCWWFGMCVFSPCMPLPQETQRSWRLMQWRSQEFRTTSRSRPNSQNTTAPTTPVVVP